MQTKVSVLRISPEIRYHQRMSKTHQDATAKVHEDFETRAGRYSSKLYFDEWTAAVSAKAQLIRNRILRYTVDGLTTSTNLPEIQEAWTVCQDELWQTVEAVRLNWDAVLAEAQTSLGRLGATFEIGNYPANARAWDVSARLAIQSVSVPAELDDDACAILRDDAEAALREQLIQGQLTAIDEAKALVVKVRNAKRAGKARKAAIRRITRLRRINLLNDPAYEAICNEAIRELQSGLTADAPVPTFDVDFVNPFGS